ncbi:MAG: calcium/sodium antiporter [Fibrobacteria bacterium]|nr:calcium/sodium antiporter [Fibrobacteria bacterium]
MVTYLLFALGLFLLIKGADWLVDGASAIAKRFGIPELVVGLTVVAFGTSAPELIINIIASIRGNAEIAVGNVLGSNIANILLILGVSALLFPLKVSKTTAKYELPFSLAATAVTGILAHNFFFGNEQCSLNRLDGIGLLLLFFGFWYYTYRLSKPSMLASKSNKNSTTKKEQYSPIPKSLFFILLGVGCLFLGGKWVVEGAVSIATAFNISEGLIAITLVAVGTSLPELATSIAAARKQKSDIATGNAIGSNIFNLLWVLGLSSVIRTLPYAKTSDIDIVANIITGLIMLACILPGKKLMLGRKSGLLFLLLYATYIILSIKSRGMS